MRLPCLWLSGRWVPEYSNLLKCSETAMRSALQKKVGPSIFTVTMSGLAARNPRSPRVPRRRSDAGTKHTIRTLQSWSVPAKSAFIASRSRRIITSGRTRAIASCTADHLRRRDRIHQEPSKNPSWFSDTKNGRRRYSCDPRANDRRERPRSLTQKQQPEDFPIGCAASMLATGPEYDSAMITYGVRCGRPPLTRSANCM